MVEAVTLRGVPVKDPGVVVSGVLGGPKVRKVAGKDGADGFEYSYFYVNVGGESAARIVAGKDEDAAMIRSLTPLVGGSVSLSVEVWNFRELHLLSVVEPVAKP